jgi:PKD repeat protein
MDLAGRTNFVSNQVTVGQGTLPTATFTYSPQSPSVNGDIFFNASQSVPAPGRRIVSYNWDFGDGSPHQGGVQTTHRYSSEGQYVVTLTVRDDLGRISVTTGPGPINVGSGDTNSSGGLVASFRFTVSARTALFTDTSSGGATSWSWNFGDPTSSLNIDTSQNPTHSFANAGSYTVALTVSDGAGHSASTTRVVTVQ